MRRAHIWLTGTSLLSLMGCANLWGFQDLNEPADAAVDQSTGVDTAVPVPDATTDDSNDVGDASSRDEPDAALADRDAADGDGGSAADSSVPPADAADAGDARGATDAGDAGDAADAADAANAADAMAPCARTCDAGCCDSQGRCQPGNKLNVCGTGGIDCQNCASMMSGCGALTSECCSPSTQTCKCVAAGIVCL